MNFHKPREIQKDGKGTGRWHYTNYNDSLNHVWPEGYCGLPDSPCYAEGHATAEEACNCKKKYDLDVNLRMHKGDMETAKHLDRCCVEGCGEWGPNLMFVAGTISNDWNVCDKHFNRETMEQLYHVGESFGST